MRTRHAQFPGPGRREHALPWLDRVVFTRERADHHLLDRGRDNPRRTGALAAMLVFVASVFFFGSADRIFLAASIPYELQLWLARAIVLLAPVVAYVVTRRWCDALRRADAHPLRGVDATLVRPPRPGALDERPVEGEPARSAD